MTDETRHDDPEAGMSDGDRKKIDEDWKRAAREEAQEYDESDAGRSKDFPQASFAAMLSGFATQALMNLGAIKNPFSGEQAVDLNGARYTIDLLGILEEKCRGNLSEDEEKYLGAMLYDLRMRFVEVSKSGAAAEGPEAADGKGKADGPAIITPPGVN